MNINMLHHALGLLDYKNRIKFDHKFSTPERQDGYPGSINTVRDAFYMLRDLIVRGRDLYTTNPVTERKAIKITVNF